MEQTEATVTASTVENANSLKRKSDDIGWEYGKLIDPNNKDRIMCNFCKNVNTGGINRFKKHIAQVGGGVAKCKSCPNEVKLACLAWLEGTEKKKHDKVVRELGLRSDVNVSSGGQQEEDLTCAAVSFNAIENDEFKQMAKREIKEAFKNEELRYKEVIAIVEKKMRGRLDAPLHLTAYLLNPHYSYADSSIFDNADITTSLITCVEQLYHGCDEDIHDEVVNIEFTKFQRKQGLFGKKMAKNCVNFDYNAVAWWRMYGSETPHLQKMAIRIMSLTSSSSACERNWSTFESIHTKKRNGLTTSRMNQLLYIQFNSRLMSKQMKIKERKNVDVLISSDSIEAQGFLFEGGDSHTLHVFGDEDDEGFDGIPWNVIDEARGASENLQPRRSARLVRDLADEEFESEEEDDEESEAIHFEEDEEDVVVNKNYMDEDDE
ncbi:unnamed protein product [Linum trigynum]|uniref:BED-type domain-containing protein n=1 Tax=Linum trigynum TaxID=586398 RepID=A0AAV2FUD9_9ROSI